MKIGVLTSGGVAPGMNAAVRAVAQEAFSRGWEVLVIEDGYAGLLEGRMRPMERSELWGFVEQGGTVLGTGRSSKFEEEEGKQQAIRNMREADVDGMVVIGGGGSLSGGLELNGLGLPTVGVSATIDNDIPGTELSIGVDTTLNMAMMIIDRIKDTASSHHRAMVVEVVGRDSGYLAVMSAVAGGADAVLIPEFETQPEDLLQLINESYEKGKPRFTVAAAEGASPSAGEFCEYVNEAGGRYQADLTILGHIPSRVVALPPLTGFSPPAWERLRSRRSPTESPVRLSA